MSLYVDSLTHKGMVYRGSRVRSCHLFADSEDELHEFAASIGMKRSWAHEGSLLHYDLMAGKRDLAVEKGPEEIDRRKVVSLLRAARGWSWLPDED